MSKRIIFTNAKGDLAFISPSPGYNIQDIAAIHVPDGEPYEIIDASEMPQDRMFRDAWTKDGKTVKEDLTKARNIAHEKRREKRDQEFAPLDRDVTIPDRAAEAEQERANIRAKNAKFQDDLDACSGVEQLRSVLLGGLNDR